MANPHSKQLQWKEIVQQGQIFRSFLPFSAESFSESSVEVFFKAFPRKTPISHVYNFLEKHFPRKSAPALTDYRHEGSI
jgi:hypothetical protein